MILVEQDVAMPKDVAMVYVTSELIGLETQGHISNSVAGELDYVLPFE